MRRFFYDPNRQDGSDRIVLAGAEAHHLRTVLRMRLGDSAELFDGAGGVALGRIEELQADRAVFRIFSCHAEPEAGPPLILALALLKGQKMEMVIQKAAELGVSTFIPVVSRYCDRQDCSGQVLQRWQRIMLEACKQCRRPVPMRILPPLPLRELSFPGDCQRILPWEQEKECLSAFAELQAGLPVVVLVGPEGGFHPDEAAYARESGFRTVSLGPRILRAETAAIAAAVLAQHEMRKRG
jgi:16S rRNA (uracil1498-N3)-methyltransferase